MKLLDPFSLVLMASMMCGVMSAVLFLVRRSFPAEIHGLGHWGAALAVQVLSTACYSFKGTLPDGFVLPVANLLFVTGNGLCAIGLQAFYGRPQGWRMLGGAVGFALVGMVYFLFVVPSYTARVTWMALPLTVINGTQLWLVLRHGRRHFATYFLGLLIGVNALLVAVRGVMALLVPAPTVDLTQPGTLQGIYLVITAMVPILLSVGFLMVATKRLQFTLERRSASDPLTGALNRRGFDAAYARELARLRRRPRALALLAIDLDHFKAVNDAHGHGVGDKVLVRTASLVGAALRESDYLARFGGEEFVVLLPDTDMTLAATVAQRIQAALRTACDTGIPVCTASIGIAAQTDPRQTLDDLLESADRALYRAKANGRDRIEMAVEEHLPRRASA
jgi:diguanylate cyclase (GGDEF)-like protein